MAVPGIISCALILKLFLLFVLPSLPSTSESTPSRKGKGRKGAPLRSSVRDTVLHVFEYFKRKFPDWSVEKCVSEAAEASGVSASSVYRFRREMKNTGKLVTPRKPKKSKEKIPSMKIYDDFTLSAIRRAVHGFFMKNEPPTLKKVKQKIDEDETMPAMSITTLQRLFRKIGFRFRKRSRRSLLIERNDLIEWRHRYLREIRQFRLEGRPIFYLDETWTFAGMSTPKAWLDTTITTSKQAFMSGLGHGALRDPSGKGERLIVLHVGSEHGFLNGAGLVFRTSGKLDDYHGDMNSELFEKWFREKLVPRLPPNAVIVMDNASYHSVQIDKAPTCSSLKICNAGLANKAGGTLGFQND